MSPSPPRPETVLPPGTRVVARVEVRENGGVLHAPGAVGIIVLSPVDPQHAYRVRFPGGHLVALSRRELAVLSGVKIRESGVLESAMDEAGLRQFVVYECVVGSRAYGLEHEDSDTDVRGAYLPPASLQWSLAGVPEQLEDATRQECFWELGKFLVLALKGNPNVLECLWTPLVLRTDAAFAPVLAERSIFLSRLVHRTFGGYALSQLRKLEVDLEHGAAKPKHAMHLLRLLITGAAILREGTVPVRVAPEHRERLIAVRDGVLPWPAIEAWRRALHADLDRALEASPLPDRPDFHRANELLIEARRRRAREEEVP